MAISTDVPIYTTTLGSAAAAISVDLSAYQDYRNLKIVASPLCNTASNLTFQFNGDTGGNYSTTIMWGNASTTGSARQVNPTVPYLQYYGYSGTSKSLATINLFDYSNSSKHKTFLSRAGQPDSTMGTSGVDSIAGTWRNNAAITSIVFKFTGGANFEAGTRIDIYGVGVKTPTTKAIGGAIYSDANYMYHVFTSTGAFTPTQSLTADILTVAGGGGGWAGAGGAGGHVYSSSTSLASSTAYTCTVGAGGPQQTTGGQGGNSNVTGGALSLTAAVGGGYGGGGSGMAGGNGGSGGGGGWGSGPGGSGTAGQGYAGGTGSGGGGGAGGGATSAGDSGPNGYRAGTGTNAYSNFVKAIGAGEYYGGEYYFCGGGGYSANNIPVGGGNGGVGGGGGHLTGIAKGMPNTGGGGNGDNAGGSGIVIVRYAK